MLTNIIVGVLAVGFVFLILKWVWELFVGVGFFIQRHFQPSPQERTFQEWEAWREGFPIVRHDPTRPYDHDNDNPLTELWRRQNG